MITWYNEMMDRSEGWYIKQTRVILFFIGLTLAISFNIDAISISKKLSTDKAARDKMVDFSLAISKDPRLKKNINNPAPDSAINQAFNKTNKSISDAEKIIGDGGPIENYPLAILGWSITALAISLGAPFWFDLLGKIMCIRQGGNNSSTDKQKQLDNSGSNLTEQLIG